MFLECLIIILENIFNIFNNKNFLSLKRLEMLLKITIIRVFSFMLSYWENQICTFQKLNETSSEL